MKNDRQAKILEIIEREPVDTQEQLQARLQEEGIACTQATISRDIKQLHLIKEPFGQGRYRYTVSSQRSRLNVADKLRTIFRESIISVDSAQNIVVVKTMAGLANAAAAALDGMNIPYVVGSLAGDDTALLIMRDTESARSFCEEIHEMLKCPRRGQVRSETMLQLLHIENIAVIESAEIAFDEGFHALTGETGAGKSIVIDAMGAVLGQRTSRDLIRTGASRAFVSALFTGVPELEALSACGAAPEDGELLLQREIYADGKNVCRCGGRPVTVGGPCW